VRIHSFMITSIYASANIRVSYFAVIVHTRSKVILLCIPPELPPAVSVFTISPPPSIRVSVACFAPLTDLQSFSVIGNTFVPLPVVRLPIKKNLSLFWGSSQLVLRSWTSTLYCGPPSPGMERNLRTW